MNRIDYLYNMASLRKQHRDGWITKQELSDRTSRLMHEFAQVEMVDGSFETHVSQALEVVLPRS